VDIYPTLVQGEGAAAKIAEALRLAGNSDCDAIILCRGGGSIEDLWSFNEEIVARAIRATRIPVVAGVGHETDFTIADFAADLRAPTPTAAAELLSPNREELLARLRQLHLQLIRQVDRSNAQRSQQLDWLASRLIHPAQRLAQQADKIGQLGQRLQRGLNNRLNTLQHQLVAQQQSLLAVRPRTEAASTRLAHLQFRLANASGQKLFSLNTKLNSLGISLNQLDPHAVLKRGYTLALGADGKAIRDAAQLSQGSTLQLTFARGGAQVTVNQLVATPEAE
jgi:exodeoxyribonuclease VII large subunit